MDADIMEELEERAAIIEFDGGVAHYPACQEACRCIARRHGEQHRAALLEWLRKEIA